MDGLEAELKAAREREAATAEVLQVINAAPGDLVPVFDALLDRALRLCEAPLGVLFRYDGTAMYLAAMRGEMLDEVATEWFRVWVPEPDSAVGQILKGAPSLHMEDVRDTEAYRSGVPSRVKMIDATGARTAMWVALRRDDRLLGVIVIYRREVHPFAESEIALVRSFAGQAVIAMENARLLTETREALEAQQATTEVLQVINSSPGDLAPVFDEMLERAVRLCEAHTGHLFRFENGAFYRLASRGVSADFDELFPPDTPVPLNPNSGPARMIATRSVVHVRDVREDESYWLHRCRDEVAAVEAGILTVLFVPLIKEGKVVGHFTLHRMEVKPFSDKQIALLQNFAAQAVIAMENARLLTETREALEQQTATVEVLRAISGSPADAQPTFDAIAAAAMQLCDAANCAVTRFDGSLIHLAAHHGLTTSQLDALQNAFPLAPGRNSVTARSILTREVVHVPDLAADPEFAHSSFIKAGLRGSASVPMLRDGEPIGAITVTRPETRSFTDKQISLLRIFADQAVIAIENARLIAETREALEQQTATAEVLGVINSSPGDLAPVFDAVLDKAHALCGVMIGTLYLYDGELFKAAAARGYPEQLAGEFRRGISGSAPILAPLVAGERMTHIADVSQVDTPSARAASELGGVRTALALPLRREGALVGAITCSRTEVRLFSEKEISLLENFAAQAVIAMDNARLLNEIRQRQAELRVTFDNMGDGVAMFDAQMRLTAWNRNFQKIIDLPDEFVARRPTLAEYVDYLAARGEYGSAVLEAEIRRGSADAHHETRFERTRPDGTVIEVRRNTVPGGGTVLMFSDVTERKRAEAEIRAARDAAEQALRDLKAAQASLIQAEKMASLGQLTAGIAHEIKNPLNFVNNFAALSNELLGELKDIAAPALATLDDNARADLGETIEMLSGNLDKIGEHGRRADNIVKGMLEHSRGVSGERREVDLNALVEESLNLAYHGARAQDQSFNITLERDFDHMLKPIDLVPQDMTRVFLNLIGNGFYAATKRAQQLAPAPGGGDGAFRPMLRVATREAGDAVEVKVRDNGTGIPPAVRDKLFQPFFTTKPTGEGTGLGLSISYDIVTQGHGGTIFVDSEVDAFTEFTIRLPRKAQTIRTSP